MKMVEGMYGYVMYLLRRIKKSNEMKMVEGMLKFLLGRSFLRNCLLDANRWKT